MPSAIDTLRGLVEQSKWKCDENPGCPTCAAEDAALADVKALLQAADHILYPNGHDLDEEWHGSELLAAVRAVKGEA